MLMCLFAVESYAQQPSDTIDKPGVYDLEGVTIVRRKVTTRRVTDTMNGSIITRDELFRAACCNLSESFQTNPSVDVNYNDATTGAKQIRLLGLSGEYVQLLTENLPSFRGSASAFALDYVPGPWMNSIQVSKGTASVKNGYEGITGQINVQYLQPEDNEGMTVNIFGSTDSRIEANVDANKHLTERLSTEILAHYDRGWGHHDQNKDGFFDIPSRHQAGFQNRWAYLGDRYIMHSGASVQKETRRGGQTHAMHDMSKYTFDIESDRYEAYTKHAFVINKEQASNIALMSNAAMHQAHALYGWKRYTVNEKDVYASLMYETNIRQDHNLSAGVSFSYDYIGQQLKTADYAHLIGETAFELPSIGNERENVVGAYAQYTFHKGESFSLMSGVRIDHSSVYGSFFTPRVHLKWEPTQVFSIRMSAGRGYRSPHPIAEHHNMLASGRKVVIESVEQEDAWNTGASTALNIPIGRNTLRMNAEYYFTHFVRQQLVDYDTDPHTLLFTSSEGKSYSHTLQVDADYEVLTGLRLVAAYRRTLVRATYNGMLREKPLTNRYKALFTASYKTPLGLWQADITLQINGGGRMPDNYTDADGRQSWSSSFKPYEQLNVQLTRWFRHFSVYVGGENLTSFKQKNPIISADNPWSKNFDSTLVYGPQMGAMAYIGMRFNFGRL